MLVRREVFEEIGLMDSLREKWFENDDWLDMLE